MEIITLGGWNNHPQLIKAYVELAKEAVNRLK